MLLRTVNSVVWISGCYELYFVAIWICDAILIVVVRVFDLYVLFVWWLVLFVVSGCLGGLFDLLVVRYCEFVGFVLAFRVLVCLLFWLLFAFDVLLFWLLVLSCLIVLLFFVCFICVLLCCCVLNCFVYCDTWFWDFCCIVLILFGVLVLITLFEDIGDCD